MFLGNMLWISGLMGIINRGLVYSSYEHYLVCIGVPVCCAPFRLSLTYPEEKAFISMAGFAGLRSDG